MSETTTGSGFSLTDQLFNRELISYLSGLFQEAYVSFDSKVFTRQSMRGLLGNELKQCIVHIARVLEKYLSDDFSTAAKQIREALPHTSIPHAPTMTLAILSLLLLANLSSAMDSTADNFDTRFGHSNKSQGDSRWKTPNSRANTPQAAVVSPAYD